MSLVTLTNLVEQTYVNKDTKVRIIKGPIFEQLKQTNSYWDRFFKDFPDGNKTTIQKLLDYPNLDTTEWLVQYDNGKRYELGEWDWKKEKTNAIMYLIHCQFGL